MGFFSKLFGKKKKTEKIEQVISNQTEENLPEAKAIPEGEPEAPVAQEVIAPEQIPVEEVPVQEAADEEGVQKVEKPKKEKPTKKVAPKEEPVSEPEAVIATEPPKAEEPSVTANAEKSNARRARFEIKRTKDDRFVFNLYAANQVIVATSQIYSSSQSALNGIKSIIANAERAAVEDQTLKDWQPQGFPKWEIYLDNAKQYRFRLDAPNGSCIVHSQGYTSKASCKNGIDSIIRNAKDALVDKAYLIKKDEEK